MLGAGPAGSAAAGMLARSGARTLLIHFEHGRPRQGEILHGLHKRLLSALRIGHGFEASIAGSVSLWSGVRSESSAIILPSGPDLLIDRRRFDASAREAAANAGAYLLEVRRLPSVTHTAGGWLVELEAGSHGDTFTSPLLLDCTGRRAFVIRRVGRRRRLDRLICRYQMAEGDGTDQDDRWLLVPDPTGWWFSVRTSGLQRVFLRYEDVSQDGQADPWLALDRTSEVGRLVHAHGYKVVERANVDASTCCSLWSAPGLLAVGDAAFSIDPLSGQGLGLALCQGAVAAMAVQSYLGGAKAALSDFKIMQRRESVRLIQERSTAYAMATAEWRNEPFWRSRSAIGTSPTIGSS